MTTLGLDPRRFPNHELLLYIRPAGKLGQQWLDVGIYMNRHWRVKAIKTVSRVCQGSVVI
jgi:hypothetical protein